MIQFDPQTISSDYLASCISEIGYSATIKDEPNVSNSMNNHSLTAIHVDGMVCINCAQIIESSLKKVKGVKYISVSVENKRAQVSYDPDLLTVHKICSLIEELGFEAALPDSSLNSSMLPALPVNSHSVSSQQLCVMKIDGMTCSSCVGIIESHLSNMEAVESVKVLLNEKESKVMYNAAVTSPQNLLSAVEDLGYTVTHVDGMFVTVSIPTSFNIILLLLFLCKL